VQVEKRKIRELLIKAASAGDLEEVQNLTQLGVDVNSRLRDGLTAIMAAAISGHTRIVNFLVDRGANLDLGDEHGVTALMYAASRGRADIVKILVNRGAKVDLKNVSSNDLYSGRTALMHSAGSQKSNIEVIRVLLAHGANIDEQDEHGETALMKAASVCNVEIVMELISAGANVSITNKDGDKAVDFAEAIGQVRIAEILRQAEMKEYLQHR
jgi:ankyrin repeat protein